MDARNKKSIRRGEKGNRSLPYTYRFYLCVNRPLRHEHKQPPHTTYHIPHASPTETKQHLESGVSTLEYRVLLTRRGKTQKIGCVSLVSGLWSLAIRYYIEARLASSASLAGITTADMRSATRASRAALSPAGFVASALDAGVGPTCSTSCPA